MWRSDGIPADRPSPPSATSWPPGSFIPPAPRAGDDRAPVARPRPGGGVDATTVGTLVAAAGWLLLSGTLLGGVGALLAVLLERPVVGLAVVAIWGVSGAAMVTVPGQWLLTWLARCRTPTPEEQGRLAAAWREVTEAAGVDPGRYRLWVQSSDRLNAFAAAGRVVAVTSHAVAVLPHRQLAAVLAHELGHHLAGHAWSRALCYWYALPARLVLAFLRVWARTVLRLAAGGDGARLLAVVLGIAAALLVMTTTALLLMLVAGVPGWLLPVVAMAPFLVLAGRRVGGAERRADEIAVVLGYGAELLAALADSAPANQEASRWRVATPQQSAIAARRRRLAQRLGARG
ncbi:M48 family metalloprotease [Natronosporangium hydrolyticum]|uniref:M48 family metalloprotease n=1 Tax=Natronosporangium hydrolyticum TaxID=2811111 RepID=A0A895YCB3_9ACTN|nr:M48 family metalloprotease [Natronosporangium hydrolyticum]QSB15427.1 M48 family metalloprotease [Natronosporangium hydrolyticum]